MRLTIMALFQCPRCGTKLAYASKDHPCKGGKSSDGRRDEIAHSVEATAKPQRSSERPKVVASGQLPRAGAASRPSGANPVAKEPEASGHNRLDGPQGTSHRGSSRLSAGRTAQDAAESSDGGRVAIQAAKRGRPKLPDDAPMSRASLYRRRQAEKRSK
jgi:hypothetical protein